jgi:hypothetical protein
MQQQIIMSLNVLQGLKDLGKDIGKKLDQVLFTKSGWKIPDDTDTGISFGAEVEMGGGYMEMDLQDIRLPSPQPKYALRGGYLEVGIGIGEMSKLQTVIDKIVKALPKKMRVGSDLVVLPGGSITQLIMGPKHHSKRLEVGDFRLASWVYVFFGGEVAVVAGDLGLMFLVNKELTFELVASAATAQMPMVLGTLLADCLAWAPYYGVSVGLGAGGKIAVRVIQNVSLQPTT